MLQTFKRLSHDFKTSIMFPHSHTLLLAASRSRCQERSTRPCSLLQVWMCNTDGSRAPEGLNADQSMTARQACCLISKLLQVQPRLITTAPRSTSTISTLRQPCSYAPVNDSCAACIQKPARIPNPYCGSLWILSNIGMHFGETRHMRRPFRLPRVPPGAALLVFHR